MKTYDELKIRLLPTDERHLDCDYMLAGRTLRRKALPCSKFKKAIEGLLSKAPRLGNPKHSVEIVDGICKWSIIQSSTIFRNKL